MKTIQQKTIIIINRKIIRLIYQKESTEQIVPTKKQIRGKKINNLSKPCKLLNNTSIYMPQANL